MSRMFLAQALGTFSDELRQALQALIATKSPSELLACVQHHPLLLADGLISAESVPKQCM